MMYSPLFDLWKKYETHVNDFLLQALFYIVTFTVDKYVYYASEKTNVIWFSLLIFLALFIGTRTLVRHHHWQSHFGTFANWSLHYCALLAFSSWICYLVVIRWRF